MAGTDARSEQPVLRRCDSNGLQPFSHAGMMYAEPHTSFSNGVPAVTVQLQGFCFVEYKLASEAVAAVGGLTGACIDGHTVQPMSK